MKLILKLFLMLQFCCSITKKNVMIVLKVMQESLFVITKEGQCTVDWILSINFMNHLDSKMHQNTSKPIIEGFLRIFR